MDYQKALQVIEDYYDIHNPSEDDDFAYTEALKLIIDKTHDPMHMCNLAWFYCEKKRFDIELKYLEMAAECGYGPAFEELGYMYYYGQHGERDYKKAFEYYTKGAEPDNYGNEGSMWCKYKLADMYRFGCYVEKNEDKYKKMIEEAYEEVKDPHYLSDPYPEICLRLAGIRVEEGKKDEAVKLLKSGRRFMEDRLKFGPFWGHIEVLGRIVRFLYELTPIDLDGVMFYDLFYLTEKPGVFYLNYRGKPHKLEVTGEGKDKAISFEGKWYRNFEEFCQKCEINGCKVTEIYEAFRWVEVEKHE